MSIDKPVSSTLLHFLQIMVLIILILPILLSFLSPHTDSRAHESTGYTSTMIFNEDFEGELPGKWDLGGAQIGDDAGSFAPDMDCGADYWGISARRFHGGSHSAWCAQVGENSAYGNASNSVVGKIDNNMSAFIETRFHFGDYDNVTLSFWYWAESSYLILPTNLVDSLQVFVYNGTGVGGSGFSILWRQPLNISNGWAHVVLDIPVNFILVGFYYNRLVKPFTPPTVEGAYIDDIEFTGYKKDAPIDAVKINVRNINDPDRHYSDNGFSNGGLELNVTWNGTFRKLVFIMPSESFNLTVSSTDLPATLSLYCSNFGSPKQFSYLIRFSDIAGGRVINVTVDSNEMTIDHVARSEQLQYFEFTWPMMAFEYCVIFGLLLLRKRIDPPTKVSIKNPDRDVMLLSVFILPVVASLIFPTTLGLILWFSTPIIAWVAALREVRVQGSRDPRALSTIIAVLFTLAWLCITWGVILFQASTIAGLQ